MPEVPGVPLYLRHGIYTHFIDCTDANRVNNPHPCTDVSDFAKEFTFLHVM